jgi:gamma-glutamyltranspeptidase/glutathione hydrolase
MPGVIAAGDAQTAAAGAEMLRSGGNAVDAAVAASFASFIAEVGVAHLGGSGIAQVYIPGEDQTEVASRTYDFFSNMPGIGADRNYDEIDFERVTIDFGPTTQDFYLGRGSVAVPGCIAGLCQMAGDHGRLPLKKLLEPATRLAREGVTMAAFQAATCDLLTPIYTHTAAMRDIFARNGRVVRAGERLFIPRLAETLEALAEEGSQFARSGRLAKAILEDQAENGGLLTSADLETYKVMKPEPIRLPYRDYEILLPPPSSSGGALTAFTLKLLCQFDVGRYNHGSVDHLRLLFEVMAATSRARPEWEKASEQMPVPQAIAFFLSDTCVGRHVTAVQEALAGGARRPALHEAAPHPDTTHISVIDANGMAVSLTTTAGESAGYVVPATGYIPNNILGEADLHPNGFHTRPAGERIHTMMTPVIVLENGRIRLVVGSGGSIRIRSAILQVLSNLLDFGMGLDEAVNAARVHLEDGSLQCELGFDASTVDELERIGYKVNRWDKRSIYFGGAHSVSRTRSGRLVAAGDNRRGGSTNLVL